MRLILMTPKLRAQSVHQYAEWREVIAAYVVRRAGLKAAALLPRLAGQVSFALPYDVWLDDGDADLLEVLDGSCPK
jgi:hypothetical protein